jgi:hypothetical protein
VRGLAAPRDPRALDAEGAEHHTQRQVHRLEHRPLLDVQLEVRRRVRELRARGNRVVQLHAVLAQRIRQRDPVTVRQRAKLVLVSHRARGGRRAEQRAPEARAFLVRPGDQPDRDRRLSLRGDSPHDLDAGEHVETAVEPPAVRHRVHVAADHQLLVRGAPQREPLVAGFVDVLDGAGALHLLPQEGARGLPRLRPRDPLRAVVVVREVAQPVKGRNGACRIECHGPILKRDKTDL